LPPSSPISRPALQELSLSLSESPDIASILTWLTHTSTVQTLQSLTLELCESEDKPDKALEFCTSVQALIAAVGNNLKYLHLDNQLLGDILPYTKIISTGMTSCVVLETLKLECLDFSEALSLVSQKCRIRTLALHFNMYAKQSWAGILKALQNEVFSRLEELSIHSSQFDVKGDKLLNNHSEILKLCFNKGKSGRWICFVLACFTLLKLLPQGGCIQTTATPTRNNLLLTTE